jgi:predicted ABC-type ATPase
LTNPEAQHISQLRLRIFAGPNGSGKSTVIASVRGTQLNNRHIDFGYYINADDIARQLLHHTFSFQAFDLPVSNERLVHFASGSGLLDPELFPVSAFRACYELRTAQVVLKDRQYAERLAQVLARFLRAEMLRLRKRFSFETVFSHASNLDIMREAAEAGYKVYLYFVATASPDINIYRVAFRVTQNGHNVPSDKIVKRYNNSLNLLYEAAQIAYQAFFFDNSGDAYTLVAHFKKNGDKKEWSDIDARSMPAWFRRYYLDKVKSQ